MTQLDYYRMTVRGSNCHPARPLLCHLLAEPSSRAVVELHYERYALCEGVRQTNGSRAVDCHLAILGLPFLVLVADYIYRFESSLSQVHSRT